MIKSFIKKLGLALILASSPLLIKAQENNTIKVLADGKTDSVVLRWAPTTPVVWQLGNQHGYIVERFTIAKNNVLSTGAEPGKVILTPMPFKPLSIDAWDAVIAADSTATVAQGAIYDQLGDGGSAAKEQSFLEAKRALELRFGYALFVSDFSPRTAEASALRLVDKTVKIGERYAYRVRIADVPEGMTFEPGITVLEADEAFMKPTIARLQGMFGDRKVELNWPIATHKGFYTAYRVERSQDGKNFKPASELPFVVASEKDDPEYANFTDSIPENGPKWYYRVKGITPFGDFGPNSEVVNGEGRKLFAAQPVIDTAEVIKGVAIQVNVRWHVPQEFEAAVKGYVLSRAPAHDGPYTDLNAALLPKEQGSFSDHPKEVNNYYRVRAIGYGIDEMASSFPYLLQLEDSIPPAVPVGLKGVVDDKGYVILEWQRNKEQDLRGYRVFRANSLHEEFSEQTKKVLDYPEFTDVINLETLSKQVYYKVIAVDKRYNTSDYSEPLLIKRPDTIPPVPAQILSSSMKGSKLQTEWETSPSNDVAYYELRRSERTTGADKLLLKWPVDSMVTHYVDSTVTAGKTYAYKLKTVDDAGNASFSEGRDLSFNPVTLRQSAAVKAEPNRKEGLIALSWSTDQNVFRYDIYRSKNGESLGLYQTLMNGENRFIDKLVNLNNKYTYKMKVVYKTGQSTALSKAVEVAY